MCITTCPCLKHHLDSDEQWSPKTIAISLAQGKGLKGKATQKSPPAAKRLNAETGPSASGPNTIIPLQPASTERVVLIATQKIYMVLQNAISMALADIQCKLAEE